MYTLLNQMVALRNPEFSNTYKANQFGTYVSAFDDIAP
jgi:hypothetical protein